jgi:hypothetical protein
MNTARDPFGEEDGPMAAIGGAGTRIQKKPPMEPGVVSTDRPED